MADQIDIGELVVRLVADAKQLEAGLKKAGVETGKFDKKASGALTQSSRVANRVGIEFSKLAGRVAALGAVYVSLTGAIQLFNRGIAELTALDELNQTTGISVERLDALKFAASEAGVSFDTLERAINTFTSKLAEGVHQPLSAISLALREMNISVRNSSGNLRDFADLLPDIADRFASYEDGAAKARLATALFGQEAGVKMLPLLNKGSAGIDELLRKAKQLGLVSKSQVQTSREYRESMARLNEAVDELAVTFGERLAPAVTAVIGALTTLMRSLPALNGAQVGTEESVRRAAEAVEKQQEEVDELNRAVERQVEKYGTLSLVLRNTRDAAVRYLEKLKSILAAEQALAAMRQHGPIFFDPPRKKPDAPDPTGLREGALESIKQAQFELNNLMDRLTGTRSIFDELNFSWQSHSEVVKEAMAKVNEAYAKSGDRRRALAKINKTLALQDQQAMLDTASKAAETIAALWPKQKGAAIAAATINTAVAITNALRSGPTPFALAQAALIAAMGAAQISQIQSTNVSGTSAGSATAGTAAAPAASDAAPQLSRSLTISGIDPAALFSGRTVRGLIETINEEVQNGVTLISTRNAQI